MASRSGTEGPDLGPTDYLALQTHTMTNPLVAAGHQSLPSRGPDRRGGRKNEGQRLPSVTRDLAGGRKSWGYRLVHLVPEVSCSPTSSPGLVVRLSQFPVHKPSSISLKMDQSQPSRSRSTTYGG